MSEIISLKVLGYIFSSLLLVDFYQGVIPSVHKIAPLYLKSKYKTSLFLYYTSIKRNSLRYITAMIVGIILTINSLEYLPYFIYLFLISIIIPFVSLKRKNIKYIYVLMIIPLSFIVFDIYEYMCFYLLIYIIASFYFIKKMSVMSLEFNDKRYFTNMSLQVRIFILSTLCVITILLFINKDEFKSLPIEQGLIFLLIFFFMRIEIDCFENQRVLKTYRARAYINVVKQSRLNFKFYNSRQVNKLMNNVIVFICLLIWLAIFSGILIDYIILFLGVSLLIFYTNDVFINHYLFQKSIIYGNTVIRKFTSLFVNGIVLQFTMYYSVKKLGVMNQTFHEISFIFRIIYGIAFSFFILIFVIRFKKIFNILKVSSKD